MVGSVAAMTQSAENMLAAFFGANVIFSLFSAGMLQYLWGLINTLQMIVMTSLFSLRMPLNADMVMLMILKMCSLEFINTGWALEKMFSFRETVSINTEVDSNGEDVSKFADAGYDSSNFVELLGPVFFVMLFYAAIVLFRLFARKVTKKCRDNFCTKRIRTSMNSKVVITRFMLEGCVEIGLSAMIAIIMVERETFQNVWEVVSFLLAIAALVGLMYAPIFMWRLSTSHMKELEAGFKTSKNSELLEGYRGNRGSLLYPFVFFTRRYLMIIILTVMPWSKYAQILG